MHLKVDIPILRGIIVFIRTIYAMQSLKKLNLEVAKFNRMDSIHPGVSYVGQHIVFLLLIEKSDVSNFLLL